MMFMCVYREQVHQIQQTIRHPTHFQSPEQHQHHTQKRIVNGWKHWRIWSPILRLLWNRVPHKQTSSPSDTQPPKVTIEDLSNQYDNNNGKLFQEVVVLDDDTLSMMLNMPLLYLSCR